MSEHNKSGKPMTILLPPLLLDLDICLTNTDFAFQLSDATLAILWPTLTVVIFIKTSAMFIQTSTDPFSVNSSGNVSAHRYDGATVRQPSDSLTYSGFSRNTRPFNSILTLLLSLFA
jgi:hypothetical protein